MLRKTILKSSFKPVNKVNEKRYIILFDRVDIEDSDLCTVTQQGYYYKPTTIEVQEDVKDMTIQRYINEGLEPPRREDIDVSQYVID